MGDEGVDNTEVAAGLHESEDTRVAQLHVSQADHTDHGRDHILMGIDSTTASVPPGIESSSKNEFAWTPVMLELVLDHVAKNGLTKLDVLNSDPVFEGLPVGLEEIEKKLDQLFEINPGDLEYYFPEMPTAEGNASEEGSDEDSKSSEPSEASEEARDRKRRKGKKDALPKYGRKKHEEDEEYQEDDSSDEDYSEEDDSEMSEDGLTAEIKMKTGFGPLEFDRELDYHPQAYYPETFKRPHIYGRPSRKAYQAEIKATQEALERFKKLEEDRPRGTRSSSRLSARKRYTMDEDIDKMLDKELGDMEEEDKPREEDNLEKLDKILAMREVTQKMIDTEKAEDSLKRKDAHKIIEEQHPDVIKELSKAGDVSETGVTDSEEEKLVQDHITTHLDVLHAAEEEKIVQYLIKSEGVSYLHCEWMTEDEVLQRFGESGYARLSRFASTYSKTEEQNLSLWGGEPFNPAFLEVERVLAKKTFDETIVQNGRSVFQRITKFLVKWSELSYSECTWETAEDINNEVKIAEFYRHNSRRPPRPAVKPPEPSRLAQWYHQSPVFKNGNTLRDYQLDGLNWLIQCYHLRRNCILADEMGLGKTIQSVSFLNYLATEEYIRGPFLCVVPLSTLEHWKREIEEWTEMGVIVYYESVNGKANRALIREYEFFFENSRDVKFDVLITTYETLLADVEDLAELKWEHIVVDEGHRLKNRSSKLVRALLKIASPRRMLLTGTPIQNNTEELWTLLNFIEPEVFYSSEEFLSRFGNLTESKQVEELQKEIRPYVLRRMKESVEKSIPQKEETIIDIELTTLQKQYYRAIYDRNRNFLARGVQKANIPSLMNIEMELRKCCNHPWLIKGVEDKEVPADASPDDYFRLTVMASGKMVLLDKLLPKLKAEGHRVLIFSQMKRVLDILEEYVQHKNYGYERLDGASQGNIRQAAIDRFSRKGSDRFVFLLSTRAGGVGLNLTAADTVILYDSDWNPQADIQAQARVHRIGQEKNVMIYRLVTRNTYEAEMFNRASKKLGLDQAVLSNMVKGGMQEEDKKDLDRLLKLGAYGLLDEDDSAARKFEESNIDEILAHGTRVIKHSENKGGESGGLGAISFSKMSFASAGADVTIDINDPDFWEKVLAGKDRSVDQVNVEDLSFELVDGTATKSVKSRKEWFERLKKKVRQTFVAKQNGHSVSDLHDLIALLKTFMSNPKFAADDKKLAQAWIKDLGRRGGKRSSANEAQYDDDDSRSESSSDDEVVGADADEYEGSDHEATQTKKGRLLVPKGELCFSCFKRGQLMYCDGPCSQPYHPACVEREDDVPPTTEAWLCPKCDISEQLCLICSEPGIIDDPEGVLRCSSPGCPSFFHISCAQEHHLTSWFRGEQKFRCPRHFCVICEKGPGTGVGSLISCVFCVNSYHLQCFPSKQEYVRLNNKWIICPSCQNDRAEDPLIQSAMKGAEESVEIGIVRKRGKPVFKKPDKDKKSKRVKKLVSGSYRVKFYDEGELIHELDGVPINNSVSPKSMPKKGKKASAANEGDELDQSSFVSEPDEEQSSQASSEDASVSAGRGTKRRASRGASPSNSEDVESESRERSSKRAKVMSSESEDNSEES